MPLPLIKDQIIMLVGCLERDTTQFGANFSFIVRLIKLDLSIKIRNVDSSENYKFNYSVIHIKLLKNYA